MNSTSFDNVHANVAYTSVDQLSYKGWRDWMNANHTHRILSCESGGSRHCIAAMGGDDLLVCFQAPIGF